MVPVTYQPNLSLKQAMDTFQANVNQGMYGSQDQAEEGFIQCAGELCSCTGLWRDTDKRSSLRQKSIEIYGRGK